MSYYFSKSVVAGNFNEAVNRAKEIAQQAGFGVVSEINMHNTFKEKLNIAFKNYTILGVCNPKYSHKAIPQLANAAIHQALPDILRK